MGTITAICISQQKGTPKHPVPSALIIKNWGIEGDAHAGEWPRQISLLSKEKIDLFRERGAEVTYGSFGENLVVEGFDLATLPIVLFFHVEACCYRSHRSVRSAIIIVKYSSAWVNASCLTKVYLPKCFTAAK